MKVAASPQIYMGRGDARKSYSSHQSLEAPNPSYSSLLSNLTLDCVRKLCSRVRSVGTAHHTMEGTRN